MSITGRVSRVASGTLGTGPRDVRDDVTTKESDEGIESDTGEKPRPELLPLEMLTTPTPNTPTPTPATSDMRDFEGRTQTGRFVRVNLVDGRYELEELLSKGGMGRVYKARHRDLGRHFALKLVADLNARPQLRELFVKEARLASSLNHPGIVSVTDFGIDENIGFFLVMELLEGETLRESLHRQRPRVSVVCDVLSQLCSAVRYIHKRGIVHCDIKPENIFIEQFSEEKRERKVKLLDFGLSTRSESIDVAMGGTVPYLAPERMHGAPASPLCDVYSLGILFYEMLAGRAPYQGTRKEIIQQQVHGPPPPPPSQFAGEPLDARADALILRAISRDPTQRQQSADLFQFELRALMNMMGLKPRMMEGSASHLAYDDAPSSVRPSQLSFESPFPLAVFDPGGAQRYANERFLHLTGAGEGTAFADLALVKRHPDLRLAFEAVAQSGRPARRTVSVGAPPEERVAILLLAPHKSNQRVESVHVTVISDEVDS